MRLAFSHCLETQGLKHNTDLLSWLLYLYPYLALHIFFFYLFGGFIQSSLHNKKIFNYYTSKKKKNRVFKHVF